MGVMRLGRPEEQQRQAALTLLRRLPPRDLAQNLVNFAKIAPHLEQSLQSHFDRPLSVEYDPEHGRHFVVCRFNRDGDSYRSPWSNRYFPPVPREEETHFRPSERLRILEETFNDVFDDYKTSYYEGGVSSVYLWDLDEGFAGAFLIKKEVTDGRDVGLGNWDSVHVVEVKEPPSSTSWAEYRLSTSVLINLETGEPGSAHSQLSSFVTRQAEEKKKKTAGEDSHFLHIGRMIEEMEISIRQSLEAVHIAKQREVLAAVRSPEPQERPQLPERPEGSMSTREEILTS